MKLAFTLFHYFPYGGLERDMLAMAQACRTAGHDVTVYTQSWEGEVPEGIPLVIVRTHAFTNHGKACDFGRQFERLRRQQKLDLVIGFNKMPGLDIYYAADVCFARKVYEERPWFYRLSGRSRCYLALERAVFARDSDTHILLISPAQIEPFQRYYQTPLERMHQMRPGIRRDRVMPEDYVDQRRQLRQDYGLAEDTCLLLMVGSDFRRKGLSRSIRALAQLPVELRQRTCLWVAGQDDPTPFLTQARALGVGEQVRALGARDDIPQLLWSADVLLHPAHSEAAGIILLEAMVAGLPVIATDACGYAYYVHQQQQGRVISNEEAETCLAQIIQDVVSQEPTLWRKSARDFVARHDVFSMMEQAVAIIESVGTTKALRASGAAIPDSGAGKK